MATVGQGSPIQTIQYNALPFEVMNYAPQILSQKHENLYNQYDLLNTSMPSDIPQEAQADVEAYSKGLDEAVQTLSKEGYSFGMRNNLSELRRGYIEKIKPIEDYNKKKAEFNKLNMQAKMNPDLIAVGRMPNYNEYRQGNTNYDFTVVSGSEYEKYGLDKATQTATKAFTQRLPNGMLATGFRDQYHGMSADDIRKSLLMDQDVKQKIIKDGINPHSDQFSQVIDRMVKGVMSRKPVQSITRQPVDTANNSTRTSTKASTLMPVGPGMLSMNELSQSGMNTVKDVITTANNPKASVRDRQAAQRAKYAIEQDIQKDPAKKAKYEALQAKMPVFTEETAKTYRDLGLSERSINSISQNIDQLIEEYPDKSPNYILNRMTQISPDFANELGGFTTGKVRNEFRKAIEDKREWNKEFEEFNEPLEAKFLQDQMAEVSTYAAIDPTTQSKVETITTNFLNANDAVFESITELRNGKEKDIKGSTKDNREIWDKLTKSGTIKAVNISSPSGKQGVPGVVQIEGTIDDKIYKIKIAPNEANQYNYFNAVGQAGNQPEIIRDNIDYQVSRAIENDGMANVGKIGLSGQLDKKYKADPDVNSYLNTDITRNPNGKYQLKAGNQTFPVEYDRAIDAYTVIQSLVANRIKELK